MKKILFIIQSYPSERSANVLCDERVIRELVSSGEYEVHCLCANYNGQKDYEELQGVRVHRWDRGVFWSAFTWAMRNENRSLSNIIYRMHRMALRIKQVLSIPLFPVVEPLVFLKNASAAIKLHRECKFDLVYAEYFGVETLLTGYLLKKAHKDIRFIPVFWDALSGGLGNGYLPGWYTAGRRKKLEKAILEAADLPIAMKSHEKHLREIWGDSDLYGKIEFLDIPRFDSTVDSEPIFAVSDFDNSKINIVFAGNMGIRDPEYIFELLSRCGSEKVAIWFFTSRKFDERIAQLAARYSLNVHLQGYVDHDVLKNYLSNADVFLNIGVDTDCLIPSKIFEYMSYGKMILSTYINEHDPCVKYFCDYPGAVQIRDGKLRGEVEEDCALIRGLLLKAKDFSFDSSNLIELFYLNSPKAFYDAIQRGTSELSHCVVN